MSEGEVPSIVLGREWDSESWAALERVLLELGAAPGEESYGHAGSQELRTRTWTLREAELVVEAETWMGLSITGPQAVIEQVRAALEGG